MIYKGKSTKNISFPLGGIGTGCIGLMGNGELNDWEIFNRPNKNTRNGYSHFAIKVTQGGKGITKVLHGDTNENLMGTPCASNGHYGYGYGPRSNALGGFPHFRSVTFDGSFPVAKLEFSDVDFPVTVDLCAFNPLIPHDEYNSSLPAAFFAWKITNTTNEPIKIDLACTVCNPAASTYNKKVAAENITGLFLGSAGMNDTEEGYSDLSIATDCPDALVQEYWYRGGWQDPCTIYWKNLSNLDRMPERSYDSPARNDHGTVVSYAEIQPGETKTIRFVISWNVPVTHNSWEPREGEENLTWRNYYATQFKDSFATATYAMKHFTEFYDKTLLFSDELQSCSLPSFVKDAVSANMSVLKSPTVMRIEDGSFWAWEGCIETVGSCPGTCQHVWNYAYAMPFLFPRLERSIREMTMNYGLMDNGGTSFRVNLPPKKLESMWRSCVDGQMGEVIKCYREWKLSGNDEWLRAHSERIFRMLEYAWSPENHDKWDADMDGVLEGRQHHTLDMELFGPSSWLQGFYLLALDCGAQMASYLGDTDRAKLYQKLYESGKEWTNKNLFNGKYFYQKIDIRDKSLVERFNAEDTYWNCEANEIKYQVADGSIIDQMLGDWHAALIGVKGVFDADKKKTALESLYKNNFKPSMRNVANMWRNFSLNDEAGTVICSYPDGCEIPAIPIPYCEETMTGFEYALAGLMISEGYVTEGENMVKAIRDRYDGEKRNPWNEIECGSNYARSMASFALLPIYSGFSFDMTQKHIGFAPVNHGGKYLFSVCESWGNVSFNSDGCHISILGSPLTLRSISLPNCDKVSCVTIDGESVEFRVENGSIIFNDTEITSEMIFK